MFKARCGQPGFILLALLIIPTGAFARTDPLHAWANATPDALERWVAARTAAAAARLATLRGVKGPRTVENTLVLYDAARNELALATAQTGLLVAVSPASAMRDKAQALSRTVAAEVAKLNLDRGAYEALAAVPAPTDAATAYYLQRTLLKYRLAGVHKDEATRAKILGLQDHIADLAGQFDRNVQESAPVLTAARTELEGLPADALANQPATDGGHALGADALGLVLELGANPGLRERAWLAQVNRGFPANEKVLTELLAARSELAAALGYASYAELAAADQMVGNTARVRSLLDEVSDASRDAQAAEYAQLLAFAKTRSPKLTTLSLADEKYWLEQYRSATWGVDGETVRGYLPYRAVETGVLQVVSRLFQVELKPVKDAPTWDASVTVYDVLDRGKRLGRFYLDMQPRDGKAPVAMSSEVVPGVHGVQLPESALVCTFPADTAARPGLLSLDDLVTFFHELGHLLHHILGSQGRWAGTNGLQVESDFIEAPSVMLGELARTRAVLSLVTRHHQTGQPMPNALIDKLAAATTFGRAQFVRGEILGLTTLALELHERRRDGLDAQTDATIARFTPFSLVSGSHRWASFDHLTAYGSTVYVYVEDAVIAADFLAQFDRERPLDGPAGARYRKAILEPGATGPAAASIRAFLGRGETLDAFKRWLGAVERKR